MSQRSRPTRTIIRPPCRPFVPAGDSRVCGDCGTLACITANPQAFDNVTKRKDGRIAITVTAQDWLYWQAAPRKGTRRHVAR